MTPKMDQALEKLVQARVALFFDHPFFGHLALGLELVQKDDMQMKTMATDGKHLYYDREFILATPLRELMGIVIHEIGHVILWHLPRRQGRDPMRFNIAADYAINALIHEEMALPNSHLALPAGHLFSEDWKAQPAEWIYNQVGNQEGDGQGAGLIDDHSSWSNWGKPDNGDNGDGDGSGQGQGQDDKNPATGNTNSEDMEQEWRTKVAQASNIVRMKGDVPAHLKRLIDEVLQPKLDWASILRDMIVSTCKTDYSMTHCNKKQLYRGFFLPGITGEAINVACVIDSSGSITDEEASEFMGEIQGICDQYPDYTIHLAICDADVHQTAEIHPFEPLPAIILGGGGTDFRPAFKWASDLQDEGKVFQTLVYFTDLCGSFPKEAPLGYQVIWISIDSTAKAPFGTIINYPKMEEKKGR